LSQGTWDLELFDANHVVRYAYAQDGNSLPHHISPADQDSERKQAAGSAKMIETQGLMGKERAQKPTGIAAICLCAISFLLADLPGP
jgi:hypothetical protein